MHRRPVGVPMNERAGAGGREPFAGGAWIHIDECRARFFALFVLLPALLPQIFGNGLALGQRLCQKRLLPGRAADLLAKPHVVHIVRAKRIAMRQQPALAFKHQQRRVVKPGGVAKVQQAFASFAAFRRRLAEQKVPVAVHEIECEPGRGLAEHARARGFKRAGRAGGVRGGKQRSIGAHHIIADPDIKQIAQNKHGIGGRAFHVVAPHGEGGWLAGLQMQV